MLMNKNGVTTFYPPIWEDMPDFNGVAAGAEAICNLPRDRFYKTIALAFTTAGNAMTIAQFATMVDTIQVCLDGTAIVDISASELVKLNLYYKLKQASFADGVIFIPFMRPWHFEYAQGKILGLGTQGLSSFTVKVKFKAGATTPGVKLSACYHRFNEAPGNLVWIRQYSRTVSASETEIDSLPKNGDLIAAHFTPSAGSLSKFRLRVNSIDYANINVGVFNAFIAQRDERRPQSGVLHYDLLAENYPEDRMPQQYAEKASGTVKTLDDIRYYLTNSAAATITIVHETLAPLNGYNAY